MLHETEFQKLDVVDVSAVVVGISKRWWVSSPNGDRGSAKEKMDANHFDVLPIDADDDPVSEYFTTDEWGRYDSVTREAIDYQDVIDYRESVGNVLRGFVEEGRRFYFLEDRTGVVGLVTSSNLNSRMARIYLYDSVCELEQTAGELLNQQFDGNDGDRGHYDDAVGNFEDDSKSEERAEWLVEYLYIKTLLRLVRSLTEDDSDLERPSDDQLDELRKFRRCVAHPVKGLLSGERDLEWVSRQYQEVERLNFELRQESVAEISSEQ